MLYLRLIARVATAINSGKLVEIPNNNVLPKTGPKPHNSIHPLHAPAKKIDEIDKITTPTIKKTTSCHI